jgi:hypothetical protein
MQAFGTALVVNFDTAAMVRVWGPAPTVSEVYGIWG